MTQMRFLVVKIPRFVLSAARVWDLGKLLRESSIIGTVAVSYSMLLLIEESCMVSLINFVFRIANM
jgi:hypothetical protein